MAFPSHEDALTSWLAATAAGKRGPLIGDDAAFLRLAGDWAVTTDQQIAGTHFPADLAPPAIARRALAVNLSDLAAVGARPRYAFLTLAAPHDFAFKPFFRALIEEGRKHRLELAGGDLARSEHFRLSLTLLGQRPPRGRWLERSAARPGDRLWLGGTIGESALGERLLARGAHMTGRKIELPPSIARDSALAQAARAAVRRHLEPTAQLELGYWLGKRRRAAAIDLSDGLALDLTRLCRESGVGAVIEKESLPLPKNGARLAAALGEDMETLALGGGEDYVLLFALPPSIVVPKQFAATPIGRVTGNKRVLIARAGKLHPLKPSGWDHLARQSRAER